MWQQSRSKGGVIVSTVLSVLLVTCSILIIFFRQQVTDQITVWQFSPSAEINTLVVRDGMSDYGKFLFYASKPELDSPDKFNKFCSKVEDTSSVLGCYNNNQIYIYNITDTQLDGIREVTAAHEMLHAAYHRLGSDDKAKLDVLLEAEYEKLQNTKQFAELIAFYARTEPGERGNELHSIIGTEIATIDPALETYYKQYFSNRQSTVTLFNKYNGVFTALADHAKVLSDELSALSASITSRSVQYNLDVKTLNDDIAAFNNKSENGGFTSQYQFSVQRSALTARVTDLNTTRVSINSDTDKYNSILAEYNSIASQSSKLYDSVDSTLAPAPSV